MLFRLSSSPTFLEATPTPANHNDDDHNITIFLISSSSNNNNNNNNQNNRYHLKILSRFTQLLRKRATEEHALQLVQTLLSCLPMEALKAYLRDIMNTIGARLVDRKKQGEHTPHTHPHTQTHKHTRTHTHPHTHTNVRP